MSDPTRPAASRASGRRRYPSRSTAPCVIATLAVWVCAGSGCSSERAPPAAPPAPTAEAPPPPSADEVVVAVVDTGVQRRPADLVPLLADAIDLVGPGGPAPDAEHGTVLARVVAATVAEDDAARGRATRLRILPVRVAAGDEGAPAERVARGVRAACDRGARVVLVGLSGLRPDARIDAAVAAATGGGCLVVAPVGNEGADQLGGAAASPGAVVVAPLDSQGLVSARSNLAHGRVTLGAPGEHRFEDGAARQGASVAAAVAAGIAAVLKARHPAASPETIRAALVATARPIPGVTDRLDFGRLDADAALAALEASTAAPRLERVACLPLRPRPGGEVFCRARARNASASAGGGGAFALFADGRELGRVDVAPLGPWEARDVELRLAAAALPATPTALDARLGSARAPVRPSPVPSAADDPDLVLARLDVDAVPVPGGEEVRVRATVQNRGNVEARGAEVAFAFGDAALPAPARIASLPPGGSAEVETRWRAPASAQGARGLLVAGVAPLRGEADLENNLGLRRLRLDGPDDPQRLQYADTQEELEIVVDAPHSVRRGGYIPVLFYLPEASQEWTLAAGMNTKLVFGSGFSFDLAVAMPTLYRLRVWDLHALARDFAHERAQARDAGMNTGDLYDGACRTNGPTRQSLSRARDRTLLDIFNRSGPAAVVDDTRPDKFERWAQRRFTVEGLRPADIVDARGRSFDGRLFDLYRTLVRPREGDHVVARLPVAGLATEAQGARRFAHLLVEAEYFARPYLASLALPTNAGDRAGLAGLPQVIADGDTHTLGHRRNLRILRVQLGGDLPRLHRDDRYFDVHFHSIAETPGSRYSSLVLAPEKAFGGPLQMLAESAVAVGLVDDPATSWGVAAGTTPPPVRPGTISPELLTDRVIATDHNVFFSPERCAPGDGACLANQPLYMGDAVPAPSADMMRPGESERGFMERLLGLTWAEEVSLASRNIGAHALSYWNDHVEGPWYGRGLLLTTASDVALTLGHAAFPPNPNGIETFLEASREGAFVYAAHPYQEDAEWQSRDSNGRPTDDRFLDLSTGTWVDVGGKSRVDQRGRRRDLVAWQQGEFADFHVKGLQFWNGKPDEAVTAAHMPFREFMVAFAPPRANDLLTCLWDQVFDGRGPPDDWKQFLARKADDWIDPLVRDREDWMERARTGLAFHFDDAPDVRLYRKLFVAAGTDAHGDFNFEEGMMVKDLDRLPALNSGQAFHQSATSRAFGRSRTYVLSSGRGVSGWFSAHGPRGRAAEDVRAMEALAEGNAILTDGPVFSFAIDSDAHFDSEALHWHSSRQVFENDDGRIGGTGNFDGGRTMLVVRAYDVARAPHEGLVPLRMTRGGATCESRTGPSDTAMYRVKAEDTADLGGAGLHQFDVYRVGTTTRRPAGFGRLRRFERGGLRHRFEEFLDPAAGDAISEPSFTFMELGVPDQGAPAGLRAVAMSNPVWSAPVDVSITLEAPIARGIVPRCGMAVTYTFPISMKPDAYDVFLNQLDATGDGDPGLQSVRFRPLLPGCVDPGGPPWTWTAHGGVRYARYVVRNEVPVDLRSGPLFPSDGDCRAKHGDLRSFALFFGVAAASADPADDHLRGPLDFHGNQLNSVAVLVATTLSRRPGTPPPPRDAGVPPPEETPPGRPCARDADCPPGQTCLEGRCFRRTP